MASKLAVFKGIETKTFAFNLWVYGFKGSTLSAQMHTLLM